MFFSFTTLSRVADAEIVLGVDQGGFGIDRVDKFGGGITTAARYSREGWQATLSTLAHGVRGTATIVDADTFRVDNFDGYDAISLWCIPAQANFGSGTFVNAVPEPSSAILLAFGAICWIGYLKRRKTKCGVVAVSVRS